jgi:hypothetical protein
MVYQIDDFNALGLELLAFPLIQALGKGLRLNLLVGI